MDSFNFLNQSSIYSTMGIHVISHSKSHGFAGYGKGFISMLLNPVEAVFCPGNLFLLV